MEQAEQEFQKTLTIKNELGLHARAAAMLAKTASKFVSDIEVEKDGITANAKSILGLLTLDASYGSSIRIIVKGNDAARAVAVMEELVNNKFGIEEL